MMLRMHAVDMVGDAGYTPLEAPDASEAVTILESRSDVALICTDIQMPGQMDGVGLAHAVHARWPAIKIIVVSGRLKQQNLDLPPHSRFLGKPLTGVGFLDAGNVFARPSQVTLGRIRGTAGFGVRYETPFGSIRFDLGFKFTRQPINGRPGGELERRGEYHLSIEEAF